MNYTPYHYAYNNPISFKDPTGLTPEEEQGEDIAGEKVESDEEQSKKDKPDEIQMIILDIPLESWAAEMGLVTEMGGLRAAFQGSINSILNSIENILGGGGQGGSGGIAGNSHNYSGIGTGTETDVGAGTGEDGGGENGILAAWLSAVSEWFKGEGNENEAERTDNTNVSTSENVEMELVKDDRESRWKRSNNCKWQKVLSD